MTTNDSLSRVRALSALVAATLVAACGGGGSDALPPPPPPPPPPATATITGKAVDGALQGVTACYDLNDNKACDATEPTSAAASDANGVFTIDVVNAEVGKHRLIVNVPASAIDKDTGAAVGTAFTMMAPPTGITTAHSVFVSPLSTLVQQQIDNAGQTQAEAVAYVKAQLGLAVSPLADFTVAANADNEKAANAARVTVSTQKQQAVALAAAVGQTDLSGSTVTQANVDTLVVKAVAGALNMIGGSAADASLTGKTGTALASAVTALAANVVTQIGLTVPEAVTAVGVAKLPPDPPSTATPSESASLAALRYTSANDWYIRTLQSTAADNTPDANGLLHYVDVRSRTDAYNYAAGSPVVIGWGFSNDSNRAGDQYWNGSAWRSCSLGTRSSSTPRDASGRSNYNYCDGFEKGTSVRSVVDISGQTPASVLTTKIRTVAGGSSGVNFADWGPADLTILGNATFPTGSRLFYQTSTPLETTYAYDVRDTNVVAVASQAAADGGDARVTPSIVCNATTVPTLPTVSLEEVAARSPGKPCVFNQATNADGTSGATNESWGLTTMSMGNVNGYFATLPTGTGNYYTNLGRMRVSFTGTGNGVVYYECLERRTPLSTRHCTPIGTGSYTIATLGDARVMSFGNQPAAFARTNFERVFVERGGKVYFGYRNPVGIASAQVRLNLAATNAMLRALGIAPIAPADAPKTLSGAKAANAATMKGVFGQADATSARVVRFGDNGQFLHAKADLPTATTRPGLEYGWFDIDPATNQRGVLIEVDSNGQDGLSHQQPGEGITSITDTAINAVGGSIPRLSDDPTGIVGMWALGSATDLKATHFVFFANGKVLSIHPAETSGACLTARQGPPGIEWSDYSFIAATGALRIFNKIYDTSGCTGAFDSSDGAVLNGTANTEANVVITMASDKKTLSFLGDDGVTVLTFYRIAPK